MTKPVRRPTSRVTRAAHASATAGTALVERPPRPPSAEAVLMQEAAAAAAARGEGSGRRVVLVAVELAPVEESPTCECRDVAECGEPVSLLDLEGPDAMARRVRDHVNGTWLRVLGQMHQCHAVAAWAAPPDWTPPRENVRLSLDASG